jgi:rhodanese-related sulfurtransferase
LLSLTALATSEENYPEEKTEIIYGAENIISYVLNIISTLRSSVDVCMDSNSPSMFVIPDHPITKAYQAMKKRGIKIRFITVITKDNIQYCKQLMNISEVRHLDDIIGNFGIADGMYYTASARSAPSSPPPLLIISTVKPFVEQQQYFFDMLRRRAIPAKQRIKEIEEGLKREFIETIQDPIEIQNLVSKTIATAAEEIDVVFSTPNSFKRYEREGIIDQLAKKLDEGVKIRILLIPTDDIQQSLGTLVAIHPQQQIAIRELDKSIKTKLVDVRSPKEFTGEILAPPEYPTEHAQRGGHIPGAENIPWAQAVNDKDGTFKSADELKKLYESKGITPDKEIITYCRIGERSSHTWFVLKYLLGYPNVKNYDGSWTEWGNMIANPLEK